MKYSSKAVAAKDARGDCLVVPLYQGTLKSNTHLNQIPAKLRNRIDNLIKKDIIHGKNGESILLDAESGFGFSYILLSGVGKQEKLGRDAVREAGGNLARGVKGRKFKNVSVLVPAGFKTGSDIASVGQLLTEGMELGIYEMLEYKSSPEKKSMPPLINFVLPSKWNKKEFDSGAKVGQIMAWGQNYARDLIGHPSNILTPQEMAKHARSLARKYGLTCKVMGKAEIRRNKMNCLLGVNSGSEKDPQFIILKYKGPKANGRPICLVGKGITFDSGGISIKPSENMEQMKCDMGGAACVIGAIVTAARLKVPLNLMALVPTTENLPSGSAYKPGDILKAMNGKTVEVINTDAEGRLILADALSYAQKQKPQAIIDVATLTGASIIALGYISSALFTNDGKLRTLASSASEFSSEKTWEMPLWPEYQEMIKSDLADIKNSSGKPGAVCTAAAFLHNFVGDYPWAHIDMAAVDIEFKGGAYKPKGASGYGVRLLVEMLRNWK